MAYAPPTESALHQAALDAYQSHIASADVREGGELWARAWLVATVGALVAHGLKYVEAQIWPDTADASNLARWGQLYGVDRLDATTAVGALGSGAVSITGTTGTPVPAGMNFLADDGTQFTNTTTATINPSGTYVAISAVEPGSAGNLPEGTVLTIQAPPAGVDASAEVVTELTGGTDEESTQAWAARIIERIRSGNGSNTAADYVRWAEAVDGVVAAHCLPLRRGPGTVSVAVFEADAFGNRTPASLAKRDEVIAYIEDLRPVTADVDAPPITEVDVDVDVDILEVEPGYDPDEVVATVEAAVEAWLWSLATGETAYLSQLGRTVGSVGGVRNYAINAPAADVVVVVGAASVVEIVVPGTIVVSPP